MSEVNDFFKEIKPAEDVLEQPIVEEKTEEEESTEVSPKNRRERRLAERLARRGEEANRYAAENVALKTVLSAREVSKSEEADFLKLLEPIFGNTEPGRAQATDLMKKAFAGMKEAAKKEFLEELEKREQSRTEEASQEEAKATDYLDDVEDYLEEEYGANFDDEATKIGFYTLLEDLSPKDKDGDVIEYANPDKVWQIFKQSRTPSNTRAKEIASRSMTRSGASTETKLEDQSIQDYLKSNNIIF